jgi:hypothetical protein
MNIRHSFSICVETFSPLSVYAINLLDPFFLPSSCSFLYVCAPLQSPYPHQIGKFMVLFSVYRSPSFSLSLSRQSGRAACPNPATQCLLILNIYQVCVSVCLLDDFSVTYTRVCRTHSLHSLTLAHNCFRSLCFMAIKERKFSIYDI